MVKQKRYLFCLDDKSVAKLIRLAKRKKLSRSAVIRELIMKA